MQWNAAVSGHLSLSIPFVLFFPLVAEPAFEFRPVGARAGGMGDTFTGMAEGVEALFWNPASVAWLSGIEVTADYERPFGMAELQSQALGLAFPTGVGAGGLSYQSYGFERYRERAVGLVYGCAFSPGLGVGIGVRRMYLDVAGVESRAWSAFDLGARTRLTDRAVWAVSFWNVSGRGAEVLGRGGMMGLLIETAPGVILQVDVKREVGLPTGLSVGLEFRSGRSVMLRAGAGGHPERLSFGIGLLKRKLRLDYAAIYHTVLGVSHRVSLTLRKGSGGSTRHFDAPTQTRPRLDR